MTTNRSRLGALLIAVLLATVSYMSTSAVSATPPDPEHKVTICHRTNSDENPYSQITVDEAAVDGPQGSDHYGEHKGPVWNPTLKDQKIEWGDIIPPVLPYHDGLNWTSEGQAVYNNGCTIPDSTTTTSTSTTSTTVSTTSTTVPVTTTVPETTTTLSMDQLVPVASPAIPRELPRTGVPAWAYIMVGIGLIGFGVLLLRLRDG